MKKLILLGILLGLVLVGCSQEDLEEDIRLYPAYEKENNIKKWGYINPRGDFVIGPKYDLAEDFIDGLALVGQEDKFGLINSQGLEILKPEFTSLSRLEEGYFMGQRNGKIGLYHREGPVNLDQDYLSLGDYGDGLFKVSVNTKEGIKFGYIDKNGSLKIRPKYDLAYGFNQGQALVRTQEGYSLLRPNTREKKLGPYKYIRPLAGTNLFVLSRLGENYGLVDGKLRPLVEEKYNWDLGLAGDYILASKNLAGGKKLGLLNKQGQQVLDFTYADIKYLGQGYWTLARDNQPNKYFILGPDLNPISKKTYDLVYPSEKNMAQGLISVGQGEKSYLIGLDGKDYLGLRPLKGQGPIEFDGEIFKTLVDGKLVYYNMEEEIIWEEDTRFKINENVELVEKFVDKKLASITYPHLIGLEDDLVQARINTFLAQAFLEDLDQSSRSRTSYQASCQGDLLVLEKNTHSSLATSSRASKKLYNISLIDGRLYSLADLIKKEDLAQVEAYLAESLGKNYRLDKFYDFYLGQEKIYLIENNYSLDKTRTIYRELEVELKNLDRYLDRQGSYFNTRKKL